jgi:lysophospholipase L1-like esterase
MRAGYLALGDSYTIGEGVSPSDRWPVQLAAALRDAGVSIEDPVVVARTGWTTAELLAALNALPDGPGRNFALVSLLIGVNDHYRSQGVHSFAGGFERLLARAIEHAGGRAPRVLVVSIPDWGVTPFAATDPRSPSSIGREIDDFNRVARERALASGARFVDVTPCSRRAAHDRALLATDGLHPSALMYAQWAALALPYAVAALDT